MESMNQPPHSKLPESHTGSVDECKLWYFPNKTFDVSIYPHWGDQGQDVVAPFWQSLFSLWLKVVTCCSARHFNSSQACAWVSLISVLCHWFFTGLGCQRFLWIFQTTKPGVQWYFTAKGFFEFSNLRVEDRGRCQQLCSCNARSQWADFFKTTANLKPDSPFWFRRVAVIKLFW